MDLQAIQAHENTLCAPLVKQQGRLNLLDHRVTSLSIGYLIFAGLVVVPVLLILGAIFWQFKRCVAKRAVKTPKVTFRRCPTPREVLTDLELASLTL